jgi:hypothetical protein
MTKITITIESNDDQPRRINPKPNSAGNVWASPSGRRYPSWSEMLQIMDELGYARKRPKAL